MNTHPRKVLDNATPIEVLTGRKPPHAMDRLLPESDSVLITPLNAMKKDRKLNVKCRQFREALEDLHTRVEEKSKASNLRKAHMNENIPFPEFAVGDYVLCCNPAEARTPKQTFRWHGPFQIVTVYNEYSYKVRMIASTMEIDRVHPMRLKRFSGPDLKRALTREEWSKLADQAQREFNCFQVEKIVDYGITDDDEYVLKVRWEGFTSKDDSWEPAKNLYADVPAVVTNYFQKVLPDDASEIISNLKAA